MDSFELKSITSPYMRLDPEQTYANGIHQSNHQQVINDGRIILGDLTELVAPHRPEGPWVSWYN